MAVVLPQRRSLVTATRCSLLPYDHLPNVCARCGRGLTGRRTRWCSTSCLRFYQENHYWPQARAARVKHDRHRCVKCGFHAALQGVYGSGQLALFTMNQANWLEVNHRIPRAGRGYGSGCHHHQANLETLCHLCHVKTTMRQGRARRRRNAKVKRAREQARA